MDLNFFIVISLFIPLVTRSHLIILRDEPKLSNISDIYPQHKIRRLMCVTDRPRDAIVWNTKFNWSDGFFKNDESNELKVSELLRYPTNYEQQCRINVDDKECFSSWRQQGGNWSIVHSYDVPMGPVYDSRWENFKGTDSKPITTTNNGVYSTLKFGATGSIAFSIRGEDNAEILICEPAISENDVCYNIIISGSQNTPSGIRICTINRSYFSDYDCYHLYDGDQHKPLSSSEWRTFVLTWEKMTKTIKLFDPDKMILSWIYSSEVVRYYDEYEILYRNQNNDTLFRFHDYSYTLTRDRGAILQSSPLILGNSQELCIDMLIGLCKHCGLTASIIDGLGKRRVIKRFRRSQNSNIEHNLPVWQNKRIQEMNISDYPPPITLELVTSVSSEEADKSKDHWAITKFQHCLPKETVKLIKMTAYQDCDPSDCLWNSFTCQKLSYDDPKSEILEATNNMSSIDSSNFENCPDDNIGPNCTIKCDSFFQNNCYGVQVCTENGCSCAQGWQGSNCTTKISTIHHASWAIPLVLAVLGFTVTTYYCLRKRRNQKYLDKERGDGVMESIPIHPITAEEKNRYSEAPSKREDDISNMTDVRESILKSLSNSRKCIKGTIATEPIYEDIPNTVDAQGSTLKTLLNSAEYTHPTIATESRYENLKGNTTSNKQSQLEHSTNNEEHVHQKSLNLYC